MEHYLPVAYCFADDMQLYLSFNPLGNTAQADAIQAMKTCIDAVRKWMIQDPLMINDDKTEFLLVGTQQQLDKLNSCSITVQIPVEITLVHAFITSRLDYCNGLLFGLPKAQIAKLQRLQNAAAKLILGIGKFSHITPALYELHWLPISLRIDYKILLLTFKCILWPSANLS